MRRLLDKQNGVFIREIVGTVVMNDERPPVVQNKFEQSAAQARQEGASKAATRQNACLRAKKSSLENIL